MIEYLLMTSKEQVFAYCISSQAPVFFLLPSSYATKSFSLQSNCFYLLFEHYPPIPQVFNCYIFFVPFTFCISPFKPTKKCIYHQSEFNLHDAAPVHRILWNYPWHNKPLILKLNWQLSHKLIAPEKKTIAISFHK